MADFFEMLDMLKREYPEIFALLNKPGMMDAAMQIIQAELDNRPMTNNQIDALIQATPYYQNTPAAGRDYDKKQALDPSTARQMFGDRQQDIFSWAHQNGMNLSWDQAGYMAGITLSQGQTPDEAHQAILRGSFGDMATSTMPSADQVINIARDYAVPMSAMTVLDWSRQLMSGEVTPDTIRSYMIEQAKSLYPSLSGALDSGITVRQYADPYAQIASNELGMNSSDFDLSDPKWSAPLNQIDPKTGARTAMTLSSWQSEVRSNPIYGYDTTTKARDQAAQFATQLAQQFGAQG